MEFQQLEMFAAVVEEGSISRAATARLPNGGRRKHCAQEIGRRDGHAPF